MKPRPHTHPPGPFPSRPGSPGALPLFPDSPGLPLLPRRLHAAPLSLLPLAARLSAALRPARPTTATRSTHRPNPPHRSPAARPPLAGSPYPAELGHLMHQLLEALLLRLHLDEALELGVGAAQPRRRRRVHPAATAAQRPSRALAAPPPRMRPAPPPHPARRPSPPLPRMPAPGAGPAGERRREAFIVDRGSAPRRGGSAPPAALLAALPATGAAVAAARGPRAPWCSGGGRRRVPMAVLRYHPAHGSARRAVGQQQQPGGTSHRHRAGAARSQGSSSVMFRMLASSSMKVGRSSAFCRVGEESPAGRSAVPRGSHRGTSAPPGQLGVISKGESRLPHASSCT